MLINLSCNVVLDDVCFPQARKKEGGIEKLELYDRLAL